MSQKRKCDSHFPPETSKPAQALVICDRSFVWVLNYKVYLNTEMMVFFNQSSRKISERIDC